MNRIIELLNSYNHALSLDELKEFLAISSSTDFKQLIKDINHLIDSHIVFEYDGKYDLTERENRYIGEVILKRNGKSYIYENDLAYEVINKFNLPLLNHDEVVYEKKNMKAYVLNILKHKLVYVVGLIRIRNNKIYFYPDEDNFPKDYKIVNSHEYKLRDKLKVRVYISDYEKKELRIERIIGHLYDTDVQEASLLYSYDIPMEFSRTALNEAESLEKTINISDYPSRHDLSEELVITIDGDDAKDFDDAISVSKKDDKYLLKVHIADVSHYVTINSALDKEAYKRGTSIYYPDHVIPMLPFALSNGLCSLRPNEKRLAMTVEMEMDNRGEVLQYDIYESIVESKHRMTYAKVNKILAGDEGLIAEYSDIYEMLKEAYELSNILSNKRKEKGGIEFDSDECSFKIVNNEVVDVYIRERGKSERIIEDFMIEANVCVASHMHYLEYPMIYRNHDNPKEDRLDQFISFVENLSYHFKGNKKAIRAKQLADCLEHFKDTIYYPMVSNYCLRSMAKAKYDNIANGHYGLGLDYYCHFTSPIRRYPDLVVHRMLKEYVINHDKIGSEEKDSEKNASIAQKCNDRERTAVELERDLQDFYKCKYMQRHVGEIYEAVISSITNFGFYVKLENTVEGLVHIKTLDGFYELDEDGSLRSDTKAYAIGDIVKVKCKEVDMRRNNIDFILYQPRKRQKWI